jgi:cytochrome d ubiquinol oxidase subunit I
MDVEILARLQFAFTIMFHYLFPPLSIGLGWFMVFTEGLFLRSGDRHYEQATRFWTKIFAANFAMGVATGIVMEFEFGTNWATYSRFVGDVFGSALAAEGIFAFFLESGFLAVLVFGWDRVSPKMHFFSTLMVACGATFSAVWIVVANSWQQTPAGYHVVGEGMNARAEITDFWAMVFNPSSVDRLVHVLIGSLILGAFFALSISAFYVLRGQHAEFTKRNFKVGLFMATAASLAALFSGHHQAKVVAEHQPAKLAAFEGHYKSSNEGAPLYIFGVPDSREERVKYGLAIPGMLSYLVHGDFKTPVPALDSIPENARPPVAIPFYSYHLMVAIGFYCIAISVFGLVCLLRGSLFKKRWLMWTFVFSVAGPYLANQAGWVAAEVGRQPWIVYGLLATRDGLSKAVSANQIVGSIIMFGIVYVLLFIVYVFVLNDKIQHGPELPDDDARRSEKGGLLEAASQLADTTTGASMTLARGPKRGRD